MLSDRVHDDVVRLAVVGEVFVLVVDDLVGTERAHEPDILRVADRRDVGAEVEASWTAAVPHEPDAP